MTFFQSLVQYSLSLYCDQSSLGCEEGNGVERNKHLLKTYHIPSIFLIMRYLQPRISLLVFMTSLHKEEGEEISHRAHMHNPSPDNSVERWAAGVWCGGIHNSINDKNKEKK